MKQKRLMALSLATAVLVAGVCGSVAHAGMRPPDVSFEGVTKIVFTRTHFEEPRPSGKDGKPLREGAKTTIVIVDKVEIARLTKLIVLRPKAVCGCMHLDEVTFEKGKSRINVHFCDHCFDIGNVSYRMPGAFHAAYQKLLAAHFAKATK